MLIVGLGNPGKKYKYTRHNAGFLILDELAEELGVHFSEKSRLKTEIAEGIVGDKKVILAKPTTFMNLSGDAIAAIATKYGIEHDHITVVYDDVALPFGTLRIRKGGSAGGHNGIKHTIQRIGEDFWRFRFGVDETPEKWELKDWVLSKFSAAELDVLPCLTQLTAKVLLEHISAPLDEQSIDLQAGGKT